MEDEEEIGAGFKMGGEDDEIDLDNPPADLDFGLDEEDPDHDS